MTNFLYSYDYLVTELRVLQFGLYCHTREQTNQTPILLITGTIIGLQIELDSIHSCYHYKSKCFQSTFRSFLL